MRAQKAAIDHLMRAITIECGILFDREQKKRLAELKENFSKSLDHIKRLRSDLKEAEESLATFGLTFDYDDDVCLTQKASKEITDRAEGLKQKFETMRRNMTVRFAIADPAEKNFLIRNFYAEVAKQFPALKSLVGKATP